MTNVLWFLEILSDSEKAKNVLRRRDKVISGTQPFNIIGYAKSKCAVEILTSDNFYIDLITDPDIWKNAKKIIMINQWFWNQYAFIYNSLNQN